MKKGSSRFLTDVISRLNKNALEAFKLKCDFYDLHPVEVASHLIALFATTKELDKYFNIKPEDSIFLKDREKYYKNLKVR